jgi:hypothetical protein
MRAAIARQRLAAALRALARVADDLDDGSAIAVARRGAGDGRSRGQGVVHDALQARCTRVKPR